MGTNTEFLHYMRPPLYEISIKALEVRMVGPWGRQNSVAKFDICVIMLPMSICRRDVRSASAHVREIIATREEIYDLKKELVTLL